MELFCFCEISSLHIKLFVGDQSAISPWLGGVNNSPITGLLITLGMDNQFSVNLDSESHEIAREICHLTGKFIKEQFLSEVKIAFIITRKQIM